VVPVSPLDRLELTVSSPLDRLERYCRLACLYPRRLLAAGAAPLLRAISKRTLFSFTCRNQFNMPKIHYTNLLLFWFPCKWQYINVGTFNPLVQGRIHHLPKGDRGKCRALVMGV